MKRSLFLLTWLVANGVCVLVSIIAWVTVGLVAIPILVISLAGTNIIWLDNRYQPPPSFSANGTTGIVVRRDEE